jgi:hypothetical protein
MQPVSPGLDTEPIIHSMTESLVATQVFFRRLHGHMTEQKLDLLQFTS